jgi:hypothetical protein
MRGASDSDPVSTLCTCCSAQKSHAAGLLPAIERYRSRRIAAIHALAGRRGWRFVILSGRHGLLAPEAPIADYDHLLLASEVETMASRVATQIAATGIEAVEYVTASMESDAHLVPYRDTIARACEMASIPCRVVEVGTAAGVAPGIWNDVDV